MRIMLIGSADLSGKKIGGQYEKTKYIYYFLSKEKNINLSFVNMLDIGRGLKFFINVLKGYIHNDATIFITSTRGTKVILTYLSCLKKIWKKPILFLVVGNQQSTLKSFSDKKIKTIDKIYFEVEKMQEELKNRTSVGFLPNCKDMHFSKPKKQFQKPFRICYFSEISYRKGFDRIVRALDVVNEYEIKYLLDVYGFFADDKTDMEKFMNHRDYIIYKGIARKEESHRLLIEYLFMVLPSRHKLEGVPGAVVDAYECELPVLCSNVGFLPYVVKDNLTGFIFRDEADLVKKLNYLYENPDRVNSLRENVFKEAQKYDIKRAIQFLHRDIINIVSSSRRKNSVSYVL